MVIRETRSFARCSAGRLGLLYEGASPGCCATAHTLHNARTIAGVESFMDASLRLNSMRWRAAAERNSRRVKFVRQTNVAKHGTLSLLALCCQIAAANRSRSQCCLTRQRPPLYSAQVFWEGNAMMLRLLGKRTQATAV